MIRSPRVLPIFLFCFALFALIATPLGVSKADDAYLQKATAYIDALSIEAMNSLTAADLDRTERVKRFTAMFEKHFAVKSIGKWVLGKYWKRATPEERAEYLQLFEELMIASYVDRFADYSGEGLKVIKAIQERENAAMVFTEISLPNNSTPVGINWRLASKNDRFKIVDVVVEGTSMSNTLRADFSSIIRREGGQVSALIAAMRAKTEELNRRAAEAS